MPAAPQPIQVEKRTFKSHANLLYDVVMRQAGTLEKSILEGIMNSIDKGANKVVIELTNEHYSITDNGEGIKTAQELEEFFQTFGTPHELDEDGFSTDARFARFRIGRGQIFAFGANKWTTNQFQMIVDIKRRGLEDWDLLTYPDSLHQGCKVEVELYDTLSASDILEAKNRITQFCKYVEEEVILNEKQINTPPSSLTWDDENELAYFKQSKSDYKGLEIYQQGVYVETIPPDTFGISGIIVTKAELKLNQARNQVMRSCNRWKKVQELLQEKGDDNIKTKKELNEFEKSKILADVAKGITTLFSDSKGKTYRLFRDCSRKDWSANMISQAISRGVLQPTASNAIPITFGNCFGKKEDKVSQHRTAIVLTEQLLVTTGFTPEEFITNILSRLVEKRIELIDLEEAYQKIYQESVYQILPKKDLKLVEKILLKSLQNGSWYIAYHLKCKGYLDNKAPCRPVHIGKSNVADGWTDGENYIAINQEFLQGLPYPYNVTSWCKIAHLILHEYLHESEDVETHIHTPEFYRNFHDFSEAAAHAVKYMQNDFLQGLKKNKKKLTKREEKAILQQEEMDFFLEKCL